MCVLCDITRCEHAYAVCFSAGKTYEEYIKYSDSLLPDMYEHNFIYISRPLDNGRLREIIGGAISEKTSEGSYFCYIHADYAFDTALAGSLSPLPEVSLSGYYVLDIPGFHGFEGNKGCTVERVSDAQDVKDMADMEMALDGERIGEDFCRRRSERRGRVYISQSGPDCYICRHNGVPVGYCTLFMHEGTAKIEDFCVLPEYQRKGFGTSILDSLINTALSKGAKTIYLVTDEDDTPKEMYKKLGFSKVGEKGGLFFRFK